MQVNTIPTITRLAINFGRYNFTQDQPLGQNSYGQVVSRRVQMTQDVGLNSEISYFVGSASTGYVELCHLDENWGPKPVAAVEGKHAGYKTWSELLASEEGGQITDAVNASIMGLVKNAIPAFNESVPSAIAVPIDIRVLRLEGTLRADRPAENYIIAILQTSIDPTFASGSNLQIQWVPQSKIEELVPALENEAEQAHAARKAQWMIDNRVRPLAELLALPEFKSALREISEAVLGELVRSVIRYQNVQLPASVQLFDGNYLAIQSVA